MVNAGAGIAARDVPMSAGSVNLWLSAGKPIGAVAAALLREDGLLDFDRPVAAYWPEFGVNGKEAITTRHLLTHTAGIRAADGVAAASGRIEVAEALEKARLERDWEPGRRAGYQVSSGWQALGELVLRLSGSPYDEFARTRIFQPLAMESASFSVTAGDAAALGVRLAVMHSAKNGTVTPDPAFAPDVMSQLTRPGSGLRGTASDLVRFYRMLLGFGELDGVRVLDPGAVAEIASPQRVGMKDRTFGHIMDWGLGVMFDNKIHGAAAPYGFGPHASGMTFGHGGREPSTAFADPAYNLAAAIVFNGMPGEAAHDRRLRLVTAALYEDLGLV